jgi:hypothetical protein
MKYTEFKLAEGYKEVTQKFAQEVDPNQIQQVQDVIAKYKDLVTRNQVQGNERNIDWWGKQGWQNFEKFVNAKSQQPSQTQQKKRTNTGKSHTLAETDKWLIVVPLDKDASCFHGKGTDWCTTKPQHSYFEEYFRDHSVTLIYFLEKATGAKWACAVHSDSNDQWFDINDKEIGNGTFSDQTGIPLDQAMKYVAMVSDKTTDVAKSADTARQGMKSELHRVHDMIDDLKASQSTEKSPEIETLLIRVRKAEPLKDYMYIVSNGRPVAMDQNMQTLIVSQLPRLLKYISNATPKSVSMLIKHHLKYIGEFEKANADIVYKTVKSNPAVIPDPKSSYEVKAISPQLQKLFIEHNPLWIIGFDEYLDPRFKEQVKPVLSQYFKKNPSVFAVVVEPGLTHLEFYQTMDQADFQGATETYGAYGADVFSVVTRNLEFIPANAEYDLF